MIENRLSGFPGGRFSFYFAAMIHNEEKYALCALNRIFGFEPKVGHAIISEIGSAREIFSLPEKELDLIMGPWSKYKGRICRKAVDEAAEELHGLSSKGIRFLGCTETGYPQMLLECEDPSIGLYVRSSTPLEELFVPRRNIAIVGTRDISPYGTEWCTRIVEGLARSHDKPAIISGLALGTDICAHRTALRCNLPTIGVMATGPDSIYPHRHLEFAERLISTPGSALVTDYPPGTAPLAIHFLRRNRIIAGMSDATILVESKIRGGGMMTARLAYSYNRDVYALPGRIDDSRSQGCNLLIKEKIAEAVDSVDGMMDSMGMKRSREGILPTATEVIMDRFSGKTDHGTVMELAAIARTIRIRRGITLDDLSATLRCDYSRISRLAGMLEMEGVISVDLLQRCTLNIRISR